MRLEGVYVATITPFNQEGKVDYEGLRALYEWHATCGVSGFVPCGTTGEGSTLNREERREVIRLACEVASKFGLKVIAGSGHNSTEVSLELIQEAKELGADAALVVTPYYNKPTQAGLIAHYETLAEKGSLPIVLYNVPGRTAVSMAVETVKTLLKHPRIVGIKEASGQYSQWLGLCHEIDFSSKALLAGDDDAFAIILALGGSGIISASANCAPEVFVRLHQLTRERKWEEAFQLQVRILPLVRAMFLETNPSPVKYALSRLQRTGDTVRLPLVGVTSATKSAIESALTGLELLG